MVLGISGDDTRLRLLSKSDSIHHRRFVQTCQSGQKNCLPVCDLKSIFISKLSHKMPQLHQSESSAAQIVFHVCYVTSASVAFLNRCKAVQTLQCALEQRM
jgi:hypothetical protein